LKITDRVLQPAWLCLLPLLLALVAPASARAAWSAPLSLSTAGQFSQQPQVAVDQSGNAVFVWSRSDGTTGCGGGGCFRIQARARSAAGVLSAIQTISDPGQNAYDPQVGIDQSDNAVFAWGRYDGTTGCGGFACYRVQARARTAGGVLSATQTLSAAGQDAYYPGVGVDTNGNAVFAWQRPDGTTGCGGFACYRVQARARTAAGALSATQTLSDPGRNADAPKVAVDQNGNAAFVWAGYDGTTGCGGVPGCQRAQARVRSAAGALSAVQTLSAAGQHVLLPQVGVDQGGNAVFAWQRPDGTTGCGGVPGCQRIQTRARSAAGALSAVQTLSAAGQHALLPQVAVDQGGNAVFAWQRPDGTTGCGGAPGCERIQARSRSAAGALSAIQTLSAAGQDAHDPQVARNPTGKAAATWARFDGMDDRIEAAFGP
jgi:hypothetical protein